MPWKLVTEGCLAVYFILTCFSMFYRTDFLNLTVSSVGFFVLENPSTINFHNWRLLTLIIALTWVYDVVYLLILHDSRIETMADGGTNNSVRSFSLLCCWISFFFRIVVTTVFWRDSHDFMKIVKDGTEVNAPHLAPDDLIK
jgi:hypothetical protein